MKHLISILAATVIAAPAYSATLNGSTGFALSEDGSSITVIHALSNTGGVSTLNLSGGQVDAIAYRPVTGQLYGYSLGRGTGDDRVFEIDTKTGALTDTGAKPDMNVAARSWVGGFDFNNSIDAARFVSVADDNLVFFPDNFPAPNTSSIKRFTDLQFASGDINDGRDARIFANAYTNAVNGMKASTTTQFAIDSSTDTLVTLDNNAGTLNTIGSLMLEGQVFDVSSRGGLEIISEAEGDNLAVALLQGEGDSDSAAEAHLRNIGVHVTRLLEEVSSGRQQAVDEIRNEIKVLTRTIAAIADEGR